MPYSPLKLQQLLWPLYRQFRDVASGFVAPVCYEQNRRLEWCPWFRTLWGRPSFQKHQIPLSPLQWTIIMWNTETHINLDTHHTHVKRHRHRQRHRQRHTHTHTHNLHIHTHKHTDRQAQCCTWSMQITGHMFKELKAAFKILLAGTLYANLQYQNHPTMQVPMHHRLYAMAVHIETQKRTKLLSSLIWAMVPPTRCAETMGRHLHMPCTSSLSAVKISAEFFLLLDCIDLIMVDVIAKIFLWPWPIWPRTSKIDRWLWRIFQVDLWLSTWPLTKSGVHSICEWHPLLE